MRTYKTTINVKFDREVEKYGISNLESPDRICYLCQRVYEDVIGKEIVGEVTFVLRKIKGRARDYVSPFRISKNSTGGRCALEIHDGEEWYYAKLIPLLGIAIDGEKLTKWAGKSMLSIEMEYYAK